MHRNAFYGLLIASFVLADTAYACRGPTLEQSLFIKAPWTGIEAELIADVTITDIVPAEGLGLPPGIEERYDQAALARINKVIKGDVDGALIKIVNLPTSCGPELNELSIGKSGIVAGRVGRDARGLLPVFCARGIVVPTGATFGQVESGIVPRQR